MAALTTQNLTTAGTAPTFGAASASDTAAVGNGKNTFAVYKNTDAATRTVTVVVPGTLPTGDAYPDKAYTLAATNGELWIPLLKEHADDTGRATITCSATAGVTVAVVKR